MGALTPVAAFFTNAPTGLSAAGIRTAIGLAAADLDTQLSGINSKTTNLPTDPADASDVAAAFVALTAIVNAVKAKTDNLTATPASVGDIPTASQNGAAAATAILANPANLLATNASGQVPVSSIATDAVNAAALAADAVAEIIAAMVASTPLAAFFTNAPAGLSAAGVRTALGLASANLDAQLDALPTATENATAVGALTPLAAFFANAPVAPNTAAIAAAILANPANLLSTNASGQVPVSSLAVDSVNASALATDAVTELVNAIIASTPLAGFFTNAPSGLTLAQSTTLADLATMIAGDGTPAAAFTSTALANAPAAPTTGAIASAILVNPANLLATTATGQVAVGSVATDAIDASALKADAASEIATAVAALTPAASFFTNAPSGGSTLTPTQLQALTDLATLIINDGTGSAAFSTPALANAPSVTGAGALTVIQDDILRRIASVMGLYGGLQVRAGNTVTETNPFPTGSAYANLVRTHIRNGNTTTTTATAV